MIDPPMAPGIRPTPTRLPIPVLALLAVCAALPPEAHPESGYVARGGSDDADCGAASPCASLDRAASPLVPGDTLHVLHSPEEDEAWLGELFRGASLQSGRYRGVIARTGEDRRDLRGFIRLATTWGTSLKPRFDSAALAIPNLADALTEQTGIAASVGRHVFIGSPQFMRSPFVFITAGEAFDLTDSETRALGEYMRGGGFVFADNALPGLEFSQAEAALRGLFREALGHQGRLRRIPDKHPIYRCFYDFNGPPPGWEEAWPRYYLEGVFLDGRLAGLFADKGYVHFWAQPFGNEAHLRLGINAVVHAMETGTLARQLHLVLRER